MLQTYLQFVWICKTRIINRPQILLLISSKFETNINLVNIRKEIWKPCLIINTIFSRVSEHGERSGKYCFCYLQGLTSTGCYETIKLQNLLFLWETVVVMEMLWGVEIKFWTFKGRGGSQNWASVNKGDGAQYFFSVNNQAIISRSSHISGQATPFWQHDY